jgi:replicative DNA helicase
MSLFVNAKRSNNQDLLRENEYLFNRKPPQAIEFEEAVLGAIMLEQKSLFKCLSILQPQSFYVNAHKTIFEIILDLYSQSKPVDILTVTEQLRFKGKLEEVGGAYYLVELTNKVASSAHIEYHSRIISQKYILRELIDVSNNIIREAYDETTDVIELLTDSQLQLHKANKDLSIKRTSKQSEIAENVLMDLVSMEQGVDFNGINTGFDKINEATGGWQKSDVIVVAARPGKGKTSLMLKFAKAASDSGEPVHIFSLEMQKEQLMKRFYSMDSEINNAKSLYGGYNEIEKKQLEKSYNRIKDLPIVYDDTSGLNALEIKAKLIESIRENGTKIAIIDYLGKMKAIHKESKANKYVTVTENICALKDIAKDLDIPIIILSQMSRNIELRKGEEPELSDLRDSGEIEQEASIVIFIHTPNEDDIEYCYKDLEQVNENNIDEKIVIYNQLLIKKNRNGRLGKVNVLFHKQTTNFTEIKNQLSYKLNTPTEKPLGMTKAMADNRVNEEELPF